MGLTFRLFREENTQTPLVLAVDNEPLTKMNELSLKADLIPAVIVKLGANVKDVWHPDVQSLIDWFMELEPPAAPFDQEPYIHVIDSAKYFSSLKQEIESGPNCPRGRNGALLSDLEALRKILH